MKVTLNLDLDDRHWAALAQVADERGVKLERLLADEVTRGLMRAAPHWRPKRETAARRVRIPGDGINPYRRDKPFADEETRAIIRGMWVAGYSRGEIAARLGITNLRKVGATLWDLGFDPGMRNGRPTQARGYNATARERAA